MKYYELLSNGKHVAYGINKNSFSLFIGDEIKEVKKIAKSKLEKDMNLLISCFGNKAIEKHDLFTDECVAIYSKLVEYRDMYRDIVPVCTMKNCKYYSLFAVCVDHNGKMDGMYSISTTPFFNDHCNRNAKIPGSICEKCFSRRSLKMHKSHDILLTLNTRTLFYETLKRKDIPMINALYFRFESFGDLGTSTQAANYMMIARVNNKVTFAWWTKNPVYIDKALREFSIDRVPGNCIIIYSSLFIDRVAKAMFPFINKVFTVFSTEDGNNINCGKRSCIGCLRCYTKLDKMVIEYVNELVK